MVYHTRPYYSIDYRLLEVCQNTIPYVSVNPGYIALYNKWIGPKSAKKMRQYGEPKTANATQDSPFPPSDTRHFGLISDKAKRRLSRAIGWLDQLASDKHLSSRKHKSRTKFKLNFITLTLSSEQQHPDQVIKRECLNPFLTELHRKWKVANFVWRAEPQHCGNIHFHIVTDRFIPYAALRATWNSLQNRLGYVDRYRQQMRAWHHSGFRIRQDLLQSWSLPDQRKAYSTGRRSDWTNPNSTDVGKIRHVKNVPLYLTKYCSKNPECQPFPIDWEGATTGSGASLYEQVSDYQRDQPKARRMIEGRLWGLSRSLSRCKSLVQVFSGNLADEIRSLIDQFPDRFKVQQYFAVLYVGVQEWAATSVSELFMLFKQHLVTLSIPITPGDRALSHVAIPPAPQPMSEVRGTIWEQLSFRFFDNLPNHGY